MQLPMWVWVDQRASSARQRNNTGEDNATQAHDDDDGIEDPQTHQGHRGGEVKRDYHGERYVMINGWMVFPMGGKYYSIQKTVEAAGPFASKLLTYSWIDRNQLAQITGYRKGGK